MSNSSANLNLPYIQPAQAQKHVTHNEAIEVLDVVVQLFVQSFDATVPPVGATDGQAYALGATVTGDWVGQAGQVALFLNGGWDFVSPKEGWIAAGPNADLRQYSGGAWVDLRSAAAVSDLPALGIGAAADGFNVLTVTGDASLFNNAGGSHQIKLNKAAAGDTASFLYQSNWSGRAEMGLAGNDDFAVKVSADGASWTTALTVEGASGAVTLADALTLTPSAEPAGVAGRIYFDSTTNKLRCFDGAQWQDLY